MAENIKILNKNIIRAHHIDKSSDKLAFIIIFDIKITTKK